jgi:alpha-beta hydrolase superfamily lysophospholipase
VRFVYIHGFASSPQSRKAVAFQSALALHGVSLDIPAMDQGDFAHLTISAQLNLLQRTIHQAPVCLIGSSMGGFLAALYAAAHPEVSRLVLLAPAFGFASRWRQKIGIPPPTDFEVFHYGDKALRRVHYGLIEDALALPATPDFAQPALIFHGIHDDVVPVENSRAFAATHPNTRLVELDSDHELLNALDRITEEAVPFLLD